MRLPAASRSALDGCAEDWLIVFQRRPLEQRALFYTPWQTTIIVDICLQLNRISTPEHDAMVIDDGLDAGTIAIHR